MFQVNTFVLGSAMANGDVLFTLVSFIILLFLVRKVAFGPLMNMMKQREQHIAGEIEAAEKNNAETKKLLEEQRAAVKQSRVEAQELIERAKKKQADEQKKMVFLVAAKAEAESIKEAAVKEIQREKDQAIAALQAQVAVLSVQIASKVIQKELKEEDQASLIRDYIKEVGEVR
ncbi:F0F1 ATP synthase subunit B [Ectobacillus funiculus]